MLHSVIMASMFSPLLALRGWKQYKMDMLQQKTTDKDYLRYFLYEGVLESIPQFAISQVRAYQ